jgi:hypothetical protein
MYLPDRIRRDQTPLSPSHGKEWVAADAQSIQLEAGYLLGWGKTLSRCPQTEARKPNIVRHIDPWLPTKLFSINESSNITVRKFFGFRHGLPPIVLVTR